MLIYLQTDSENVDGYLSNRLLKRFSKDSRAMLWSSIAWAQSGMSNLAVQAMVNLHRTHLGGHPPHAAFITSTLTYHPPKVIYVSITRLYLIFYH